MKSDSVSLVEIIPFVFEMYLEELWVSTKMNKKFTEFDAVSQVGSSMFPFDRNVLMVIKLCRICRTLCLPSGVALAF